MPTTTCTDCETLGALPSCNQPECPELPHLTAAKYTKTFTLANGEETECQVCGYTCKPCAPATVSYKKWSGTDLEDATCEEPEYPEELWQPSIEEIDLNSYCVDEVVVQYNYGTNPHPDCPPKTRNIQGTCNDCYWDGSDYYVCGEHRWGGMI